MQGATRNTTTHLFYSQHNEAAMYNLNLVRYIPPIQQQNNQQIKQNNISVKKKAIKCSVSAVFDCSFCLLLHSFINAKISVKVAVSVSCRSLSRTDWSISVYLSLNFLQFFIQPDRRISTLVRTRVVLNRLRCIIKRL